MPLSPTTIQSATSRTNGALSHGPTTPEGRARSSQNATTHGLTSAPGIAFALLPGEDPAAFDALLAGYLACHDPADEAERLWVERMAAAAWRLLRLEALEARAFAAALADEPPAPAPDDAAAPRHPPLPSFATLARYRARIERDHRMALPEADRLRALRPRAPARMSPAQLRWIADRMGQARAAPPPTPANDAEPAAERRDAAPAPVPHTPTTRGTNEPEPAAAPAPVPPAGTLNRHERRRLAALQRRAAR